MTRLIALMIAMVLLCGCSELQVIGKASIREITADAISVEKERYAARSARTKARFETSMVLAKAETRIIDPRSSGPNDQKELWRH